MKKITLIAAILGSFLNAHASTSITTPTVSGHWTIAGSPYLVFNSITVNAGTSLVVDPGVEVSFQGFYQMTVLGGLTAIGTLSQPISFHVQDTTGWADTSTAGGWAGVVIGTYGTSSTDSSTLAYCNMQDMKRNGLSLYSRNLLVSYCNFYHNNTAALGGDLTGGYTIEMAHCTVHDNKSTSSIMSYYFGNFNFHDCQMYNNNSGADMLYIWGGTVLFQNNEVYYNTQTDSTIASSIDFNRGSSLITGNRIHHNSSCFDGVLCVFDGNSDINGNFVTNNSALTGFTGGSACGLVEGGGGIRVSSQDVGGDILYKIRNNVIANNYAGLQGGGIDVFWANAMIANNTIVNNTAGFRGGGIYVFNDSLSSGSTFVTIKNNIFKNNSSPAGGSVNVYVDAGHYFQYDHNWTEYPFYEDIWNSGFGCHILVVDSMSNYVGTDPGLIAPTLTNDVTEDATSSNFGIDTSSTCINRGDTAGIYVTMFDIAGYGRIQGGIIDMGAYESVYWRTTAVATQPTARQIAVYPNPAGSTVSVQLPEAAGTIELRNVTGQLIATQKVTSTLLSLDIHNAPRGLYFITWKNGSQTTTDQLIAE